MLTQSLLYHLQIETCTELHSPIQNDDSNELLITNGIQFIDRGTSSVSLRERGLSHFVGASVSKYLGGMIESASGHAPVVCVYL